MGIIFDNPYTMNSRVIYVLTIFDSVCSSGPESWNCDSKMEWLFPIDVQGKPGVFFDRYAHLTIHTVQEFHPLQFNPGKIVNYSQYAARTIFVPFLDWI